MNDLALILPDDMDDDAWAMIEMKEWFPGARLLTPDGYRVSLTFMTQRAFMSNVAYHIQMYGYYFEDNIVIIDSMTLERMRSAVQQAWDRGDFRVQGPAS